MSGLQRGIEIMSPERYARVTKDAAELAVSSNTRLGRPVPEEIQRLVDMSYEDLVEERRSAMKEQATHAQNAIDRNYPAAQPFLPRHLTRDDFEEVIRALYHVRCVVIQRDVLTKQQLSQ